MRTICAAGAGAWGRAPDRTDAERAVGAPLLISLPHGLNVSGVTMWAVRLAGALCGSRPVGLVVHAEPVGQRRLDLPVDERVRVFEAGDAPPIGSTGGDLGPYLGVYRRAVEAMGRGPVVLSPNLHGDAYGIGAALTRCADVRLVGWQHADNVYDTHVLLHYAPVLARFVGVSAEIAAGLRASLGARARDVEEVPYGVPVPARCPRRGGGRCLRLLYVGRLELAQKRADALPLISDLLGRSGVLHRLTVVGDGPAAEEVRRMCARLRSVRCVAPAGPAALARLYRRHDALVLPSRYEGLSVAMLEAMACGCVPVVPSHVSGVAQAVGERGAGVLVDAPAEADARATAEAFAARIGGLSRADLALRAVRAWETVRDRFSLAAHAQRAGAVIDAAAQDAARVWPGVRPAAFSAVAPDGSSGSVPRGGREAVRRVLESLSGRAVVVHGTGQHTRQLRDVILGGPARVVAFADDDPSTHGSTLWGLPVVPPRSARRTGARDVVISSWMHAGAIWDRRGEYERQGMTVHNPYPRAAAPAAA